MAACAFDVAILKPTYTRYVRPNVMGKQSPRPSFMQKKSPESLEYALYFVSLQLNSKSFN